MSTVSLDTLPMLLQGELPAGCRCFPCGARETSSDRGSGSVLGLAHLAASNLGWIMQPEKVAYPCFRVFHCRVLPQ